MTNVAHRKPFLEISFHSFPFFPEPDTTDISRYRSQLKLRSPGLLALNISLEPKKTSKHLMLSNCMSFPDTSFQWMCAGPCASLKAVAERADQAELDSPIFNSMVRMLTAAPGLDTRDFFASDALKPLQSILLWFCIVFLPAEPKPQRGSWAENAV